MHTRITSKDNKLIKYISKLKGSKKFRDEEGKFIIEGYNLVSEAYKKGIIEYILSSKDEELYESSITVSEDIISKLTDTVTPQNILAVVRKENSALLSNKVLYLDNIQDPGNLGTLLRSAVAFNFNTVILDNTCDQYNPKVIRATEGAIFKLSFMNLSLSELKSKGYKILSTSMHGEDPSKVKIDSKKIVLILGNEGSGVKMEYIENSDIDLTIPMNNTESLNVAVAGSILMHELNRTLE